ncbi:MAG: radical SAM protein [Bacteroidales bacterium]|nr:MAG: radical SAM protein [Bacteroidales bacterium]
MDFKVLLNWLPPAQINSPSISLSVLKSYLNEKNINSKIIYWNVLFHSEMKKFFGEKTDDDMAKLLPFINILNNIKNNIDNKQRIISALQAIKPEFLFEFNENLESTFNTFQKRLLSIISKTIKEIDFSQIKLVGFSSKFNQWIPAIVISNIIKQNHPEIKIVIGGFGDRGAAKQMLEYCSDFDFAIWGEGEDPLVKLLDAIDNKNDYNEVPGLAFRDNNEYKLSQKARSYININKYTPCFDDYFKLPLINNSINTSKTNNIVGLINSIRGCNWNRCKFCVLNQGYKYREVDNEITIKRIEEYIKNYNIYRFEFVDNDITGNDRSKFINFLEALTILSSKHQTKIEIYGEIIPANMNSGLIKKMKIAGIEKVQIGFEALTDNLLKKMDKGIGFSDSILFIKFASKNSISITGANVIMGIPNETEEDVHESIVNLHFLRFFMGKKIGGIKLNNSQLGVYKGSRFYSMLKGEELECWNSNIIFDIIPKECFSENRFINFGFVNIVYPNYIEWEKFRSINKVYEESNCYYRLIEDNNIIYYSEFYNGKLVKAITFDEPIYWDCLKFTNNQVQNFESLYAHLLTKYELISESMVKEILAALKTDFLMYYNSDQSQIVSIIDTCLTS